MQVTQKGLLANIEAAAPSLGVQVIAAGARDADDVKRVIDDFANTPAGGRIVLPNPITIANRGQIIALLAHHRMPAIYNMPVFACEGGLVSYGADDAAQYRQAASYIDRILKGAKAAELPVQQATKFEFIINLKTARALGLTVPPTILTLADELID